MVRKKEEYNTSQLLKEAKKELKKLENMQRKIEKFQEKETEGCLKYQKKGKKTYFYHQIWNEKSKSWERKYIKKCSTLPEELVKKQYYSLESNVARYETVEEAETEIKFLKRWFENIWESIKTDNITYQNDCIEELVKYFFDESAEA